MDIAYKKAGLDDLERLAKTRVKVLRAANQLDGTADMTLVKRQSYEYYQTALREGDHVAYLAFDGERLAGAGGVSFYRVMPTYHNPTGRCAYIMNMYTDPAYRRMGIAYRTLDLLVSAARERGIFRISLEATEMGRPLYARYGFVEMKAEMELPGQLPADGA